MADLVEAARLDQLPKSRDDENHPKYAWATVWVLERWRASISKALVLKRT